MHESKNKIRKRNKVDSLDRFQNNCAKWIHTQTVKLRPSTGYKKPFFHRVYQQFETIILKN